LNATGLAPLSVNNAKELTEGSYFNSSRSEPEAPPKNINIIFVIWIILSFLQEGEN
jgi:hypothetical protein